MQQRHIYKLIAGWSLIAFCVISGCEITQTPVAKGQRRDWAKIYTIAYAESIARHTTNSSKYPRDPDPDDSMIEKYYLAHNQFVFIFNRSGQRVGFSSDSQTSISDLYKSGTIFIYGAFTDGEVRVFEGSPWKE